jgi:virginiamycin B lyase
MKLSRAHETRERLLSALLFVLILGLPMIPFSSLGKSALYSYSSATTEKARTDPGSPIRLFNITTPNAGPNAIVSAPNNTFWFTEYSAGKIGEFFASNDSFREFTVPEAGAEPDSIAIDHQGRVWFSDYSGSGKVWEYDPSTSNFTPYVPTTPKAEPLSLVADSENDIWFTEFSGNKLGELVYPNYNLKEYSLPVANAGPAGIAIASDSSAIWITEATADALASFNPSSDSFTQYNPPSFLTVVDPVGVALDHQGRVWFGEHGGSSVIEFTPSNSTWQKYPTSTPINSTTYSISAVATVAIDSLGNVWFVEHFLNEVGRLIPSNGTMDEFQIPSSIQQPSAYSVLNTIDSNGNFWFTDFLSDQIGMIAHNVSSPLSVSPSNGATQSVGAGENTAQDVRVTNNGASLLNVQMQASSSFHFDGQTSSSEVSFNDSAFSLNPGQSTSVEVTVSPSVSLSPGLYTVSVIAAYGNGSSVGTIFLHVSNNFYFLYELYSNLPVIVLVLVAVFAVAYFFLKERRK